MIRKRYSQEHYLRNKDKYLDKQRELRERNKAFIEAYKDSISCIVCGESTNCCLDFHHLDGEDKEFGISQATNNKYSIGRILSEIEKCVCVCSNCHRKIHAGLIQI